MCCAKHAPACHSVLKVARYLRPIAKSMVPSWVVLEAICEPTFEPLESLDIRMLSYKTAAGSGISETRWWLLCVVGASLVLPICDVWVKSGVAS